MKAVFFDRDGTIIEDIPYLNDAEKVKFLPHVIEGLRILYDEGFKLFIITNQSGVGRGLIKISELEKIHEKIRNVLKRNNVEIEDIFYCPHHPDENCNCRKPKTGLIEKVMKKYPVDLKKSYFIGDKEEDILLAKRVGIKSISLSKNLKVKPDFEAKDFKEAVLWIVKDSSS